MVGFVGQVDVTGGEGVVAVTTEIEGKGDIGSFSHFVGSGAFNVGKIVC